MYNNGYCHGLCMSIGDIGDIEGIDGACFMWMWTGAEDKNGVGCGAGCGGGCRGGCGAGFRGGEEG